MPKPVVSLAQQCRAYSFWGALITQTALAFHQLPAEAALLRLLPSIVVLFRVGCVRVLVHNESFVMLVIIRW